MVLLVAIFAVAACGSSGNSQPSSYDGTWKADNFFAVITPNHIEIQMGNDEDSSLYWVGTFPQGSDHITSIADRKKLENAILGSQDSEKVFTLGEDHIDFRMSILGTTRTVH